jgi:hypothetical protein
MTVTQLPLYQNHYNRQLFADHYLNTVLPQRADWQHLAAAPDRPPCELRPGLPRCVHSTAAARPGLRGCGPTVSLSGVAARPAPV